MIKVTDQLLKRSIYNRFFSLTEFRFINTLDINDYFILLIIY